MRNKPAKRRNVKRLRIEKNVKENKEKDRDSQMRSGYEWRKDAKRKSFTMTKVQTRTRARALANVMAQDTAATVCVRGSHERQRQAMMKMILHTKCAKILINITKKSLNLRPHREVLACR
jgi:hypothetical protein